MLSGSKRLARNNGRFFGEDVPQDGQKVEYGGFIPELSPSHQIGVVYPSLRVDVLAGAHHHGVGGCHVAQRRLARVGVRHPYGDGEAVGRAAEDHGDGAREMEEQGRDAIVESMNVGPRRQGRILGEGLGYVVVRAIDVVIFAGQDAVQPVEDVLLDDHVAGVESRLPPPCEIGRAHV